MNREKLSRRQFVQRVATTVPILGQAQHAAAEMSASEAAWQIGPRKAARLIYLVQAGGPSQLDLFDEKPSLQKFAGKELDGSAAKKLQLTTMTSGQADFRLAPSEFSFSRYGECGATFSSLVPHLGEVADQLCFIRSMQSSSINHNPGLTLLLTGAERKGRPSLGAWLSYAFQNATPRKLPAFVAMTSEYDSPLVSGNYLWGSGFLPRHHQAVKFTGGSDPLFYLRNPDGITPAVRKRMVSDVESLVAASGAEDELTRSMVANYQAAVHLQDSLPELADISDEPKHVLDMYGPDVTRPGTYAYCCLMARRLAERGVPAVQLIHRDWDHHERLHERIVEQCGVVDQPSAALIKDLRAKSMLDDTLVVWGGEFGRTPIAQGTLGDKSCGRDHHANGFTIWMAGGGTKPGFSLGNTDEFGLEVIENAVDIHDLNATILRLMGVDHKKLTYRALGRDFRLTDVAGRVVEQIIA